MQEMGRVHRRKAQVINLAVVWKLVGKKAKISESKQRWMPDKKEWKQSDSSKGDGRKIIGLSGPGLFAGATGEHPSRTGDVAKKCPIQKSHHTLQECQKFEGMSTSEKENVVGEHSLCLSCLLPVIA